ncbi:lipoyl(octanoyl) transferase LipB [Rubrobacter tropicus]|uniref:Octanoyltransferase n=1 Tax=Rubrobacter tropicus TaxID=2653851 RepID=A0A6G8Q628_9ACTN|nr:lipoyl(octanoyl) transferase LipB [Rubrobacter tropicus]QIN81777.1 lipoyl(octanoyl) transferase LipB [Rubrobacter tropicus]
MNDLEVRRLPGLTPYAEAWDLQRDLARRRKRDEVSDTFILCEHPPVYTVGRAAKDGSNLGAGEEYLRSLGAEVFWSDRGGDATFHGPGQIVGYPIIRLKDRDTHGYLRRLEDLLIGVLAEYGLQGWHHPEYTGVWVGEKKIAAIGVKFSSGWIASHGFALNVNTDLSWFDRITPCGIKEFGVTSLARELDRDVPLSEVEERVVPHFLDRFG